MEKYSVDSFFNDKLTVFQPQDGYRFSIDSIILAAHICAISGLKVLDIGTGCGIIPVLLGYRFPTSRIIGIEIQKQLAKCAQKNIIKNQLEKTVSTICQDIRKITPQDLDGSMDLVISNPPYKKKGSGRLNPSSQKAIARHEISLELESLLQKAYTLLKPKGEMVIIYPTERLAELILSMKEFDLQPSKLRYIHSKKKTDAKRVIVSGIKDGYQNCSVTNPFYIYESDNEFTKEYAALFKP